MVSGKIENEPGWKRLSTSKFSKRHFFPMNSDSSCCGGALLSEEQCAMSPEAVKDDAEGNCPKCQKLLKDNPDFKAGYTEPSDDGISAKTEDQKPKKVAKDPDEVQPETKTEKPMKKVEETKKVDDTKKAKKPEKVPTKAQVETTEKPKGKDKSTPEKQETKKQEKKPKKKVEKPVEEKKTKEPKTKKPKEPKEKKLREGVPSQVISPFTSVEELVSMAKTLDKAEVRPLVAASSDLNNEKGSTACVAVDGDVISPLAIWNVSRQRLSSIVSDEYSLVQHQDVVKLVGKGLKTIDAEVYGTLKNVEDVMIIEVFFPKLHLKDDAKGIDVGGKIINSYNKARAFKGHMMANRKVCSNGMYLRKLISDVEFFEIHVGDLAEKIPEMVQDFFSKLKEATSKVNDIINGAMETTIEFEDEDQIEPTISGILSSPMHAKRIMDGDYYKAEDKLNPTVWELYNSITNYISHAGLVESRVDDLSNKVERLLDHEYPIEILNPKSDDEEESD